MNTRRPAYHTNEDRPAIALRMPAELLRSIDEARTPLAIGRSELVRRAIVAALTHADKSAA